jgi:hypothetical protein
MNMKPNKTPDTDEFKILDIDPHQLDKEWISQPRFFMQYALQAADARRAYEEAKAALKVVAAEQDNRIRQKAAALEEKTTEAAISAQVIRSKSYREAEQTVFDSKHHADVMDAATEALRHRKDALENLVRLRLSEYYSEPRATGNAKDMVDDMRMRRTVKDRSSK